MSRTVEHRVELVWNREFHWCHWDYADTLPDAIKKAKSIRDSGDGMRVKKVRVLDHDTEEVLWRG